jgi:phospholipid-binding lipoprotein MlaA
MPGIASAGMQQRLWRRLRRLLTALALLSLCGCASQPAQAPPGDLDGLTDPGFYAGMEESFRPPPGQRSFFEVDDPWGPLNRKLYVFNSYLDNYVLLPVVRVYRYALPEPARQAVTNFFANLNEVTTFINLALQMKGVEALSSGARFFNNTTLGILGLMDVATPMGIPKYQEDLGQTLGHYGVGPGPYMVLPLFGPSSLRDTTGLAGDFAISWEINVFGVRKAIWASIPLTALDIIQTRDNLAFSYGDLSSPFEYEMVRYLYLESRELNIRE